MKAIFMVFFMFGDQDYIEMTGIYLEVTLAKKPQFLAFTTPAFFMVEESM